jgi:hypothetical protein
METDCVRRARVGRLPYFVARDESALTLTCHSPTEYSPLELSAPVRPPDSAIAIAVHVTA